LEDILLAAYPCKHIRGRCAGFGKWRPIDGHVPRGFGGTTRLSDIRLVLIAAEPANPVNENYSGSKEPSTILEAVLRTANRHASDGSAPFHKGVSSLLKACWGFDPAQAWQRTWYTNTVLCSADKLMGNVPAHCARTCIHTYLNEQLRRVPHAFVIALGHKARSRLAAYGPSFDPDAFSTAAHPSNWWPWAKRTREGASNKFREWARANGVALGNERQ
jgi:hypothetical protein